VYPENGMRLVSLPLQVANLAVVLLAPATFLALRSRLPASVPLHFGLGGEPTRYGSPDELWSVFVVMAFLYGLLWLVIHSLATQRETCPEAPERFAELDGIRRRGTVRLAEWVMLVANLVVGSVAVAAVVGSLPGFEGLHRRIVWLALGIKVFGLGAPLLYWTPRLSRIQREIRALPGKKKTGREAGWRGGGLFYYDPRNPAVFVPKRLGVGFTLNFGRPGAWLFLAVVVGIPLLAVALG
jgi:uncharacterized membrane protein